MVDYTENFDPLVSTSKVRKVCGDVSDMTLWRWLQAGAFPKPTYIGRRRFWRASAVEAWLAECEMNSPPTFQVGGGTNNV
jgi:predicted DNA-binding transcriptional regulator AlpA